MRYGAERLVERVAGTAVGLGHQMAVQVHGRRDRPMAKSARDLRYRHSLGKRGAGERVSKIMKRSVTRQSWRGQRRFLDKAVITVAPQRAVAIGNPGGSGVQSGVSRRHHHLALPAGQPTRRQDPAHTAQPDTSSLTSPTR